MRPILLQASATRRYAQFSRGGMTQRSNAMSTRYGLSYSILNPSRIRLYSSTVHENDPEVLETEKARNLSKEQHRTSTPHEHAPGWNEYIATSSEAHVKADKATGTVEEMQTKTVQHIKSRHADEATEAPKMHGSQEAAYEKDIIHGPLGAKSKGVGDAHSSPDADKTEGPLASAKGKVTGPSGEDIHHGNTSSEDAVKADRGEH